MRSGNMLDVSMITNLEPSQLDVFLSCISIRWDLDEVIVTIPVGRSAFVTIKSMRLLCTDREELLCGHLPISKRVMQK